MALKSICILKYGEYLPADEANRLIRLPLCLGRMDIAGNLNFGVSSTISAVSSVEMWLFAWRS